MTNRALLILAAMCLSTTAAFAQDALPKVGNKPLKPKEPMMGCKFVGTVKGTKLWAGTAERQS